MVTIKGVTETELIVKKSRFLGLACRIASEAEAQRCLDERRKKYRDARHHCFAYIIDNGVMRCSDDGEPQGTAGQPMLEVLTRSGLTDVIVISTRYFGGTLLGAPGLVRAYTQSATDALQAAPRINLILCSVYLCRFDFPVWARIQTMLAQAGHVVDDILYTDKVAVRFFIKEGEKQCFLSQIKNLTLGQTVPELTGSHMMECNV